MSKQNLYQFKAANWYLTEATNEELIEHLTNCIDSTASRDGTWTAKARVVELALDKRKAEAEQERAKETLSQTKETVEATKNLVTYTKNLKTATWWLFGATALLAFTELFQKFSKATPNIGL